MVKKAVLVGCNYPGTGNELQGCVNDVIGMYRMLVGKFGFESEDVMVLVDTDSNYPIPTGANIRAALHIMVQDAQPGDTFFFHFSGHGTRIPVDAGEVDDTGFDECICPCDGNLIEDDDFREIINMLPGGATFTLVSDSCQSGGLIDQAKEQIGNSFEQLTMAEVAPDPIAGMEGKPDGDGEQRIIKKELSAEALVEMLRKRSGRDDIEVSSLRSTVFEMFGEEASSKVKKQVKGISNTSRSVSVEGQPGKKQGKAGKKNNEVVKKKTGQKSKVVLKKKKGDSSSSSSSSSDEDDIDDDEKADTHAKGSRGINDDTYEEGDGDEEEDDNVEGDEDDEGDEDEEGDGDDEADANDDDEGAPEIDDDEIAATYEHVEPVTGMDGDVGVLISGCQSHQTSADVRADPPHGALTNGIITVLQMLEPGEPVSNRQLVMRVRRYLASRGLTQEPGLYCSDDKGDQPFICVPVN